LLLLMSVAAVTFIGWNVLYLLSFKGERLRHIEGLCVSYGLGAGLVTLEMFFFYFFNIKYTVSGILAPWVLLILLNLVLYIRQDKKSFTADKITPKGGYRALGYFLIFCLAAEVAFTFFRAMIKPIEAYDAIAIYSIKSKIFYLAGSIPNGYFSSLGQAFPHPDYPLNIPLFETYIYLFLGKLNDQLVKVIFPLYYLAILGIFYYAVRRFAGKTYALLFTFLMASVSQFSSYATNGYADLPIAYYYFVSAVFLFSWFQDTKSTGYLAISAIMAALAGWTKNEGLMYCLINFIVIGSFLAFNLKKVKRMDCLLAALYVLTVVLILSPFLWIRNAEHLVNTDIESGGAGPAYMIKQFYKLGPILYEFQKEFFGPKKWNILWPIIALAFIFRFKNAFRGIQKYAAVSIMLAILGYVSIYMISRIDITFFVEKTMSRFLIHFMPLAVYWLAMLLKEDINI
jgi:hypothetical protein